jgi:hypothetical protein
MAKLKWITEAEASEMLRRKPRTIRAKVKRGEWDISYRTLNGRSFEYDENGIQKVKSKEQRLVA